MARLMNYTKRQWFAYFVLLVITTFVSSLLGDWLLGYLPGISRFALGLLIGTLYLLSFESYIRSRRCGCIGCLRLQTKTEYSPYMNDYCNDCTERRCDVSFHGRYENG